MKKFILMGALLFSAPVAMTTVSSCSALNYMQSIGNIANVGSTAQEIAGALTGTLGLNGGQSSSLVNIFSTYINGTNGISGLITSGSKSNYLSQLNSLNTNTLSSLKGVLTAAQFSSLLNLGGSKPTPSSLIGAVSGGSSLSGGAKQVLQGLLLNQAAKGVLGSL